MAQDESTSLEKQQKLAKKIHKIISQDDELLPTELSHSEKIEEYNSKISELLEERKEQRKDLLLFVKSLTSKSFWLLAVIVVFQGLVRLWTPEYEVVNNTVFNILAISVFGQVIGVIFAIVKSLWNDSEYLKKI
ncbi:MAG: hypothetical protein A3A82_00325 [Candidatus Pacebacteria bacterium RIFCSPLOWO2_01_FULL_47_12]|nr:MAG: hypothetical protein A3J60_03360 [Candidatus Pacebacteria bacterium RIFCSPHIGHO2_02_FULL_46_9]OGJ39236.1 MAG: hypothetical protein A3A82_00325 [Candidatus Pacebacteria bacterium RIFCSPLOWO2_01_FULL_47_12]